MGRKNRSTQEMVPTVKVIAQHGGEKFTELAIACRRWVSVLIAGRGGCVSFLTRLDVAALGDIYRFTQSSAYGHYDPVGIRQGGRKLFDARRKSAEAAAVAEAAEVAERWAVVHDPELVGGMEMDGWMAAFSKGAKS